MPPKRDEAALQEEEELQLAIALSQSEAEEKERMVSCTAEILLCIFTACLSRETDAYLCVYSQRQKNSYSMYPKADPTPVTSSAPPVSTLYTSPVVRLLLMLLFSLTQQVQWFAYFKNVWGFFFSPNSTWYSFQNSSAPSAEDVDPEVHVVSYSSSIPAL